MWPPAPMICLVRSYVALTSHSRRLPCGPVPVPQAPSPPLTHSNPNLSGQQHHGSPEVGTLQCQSPAQRCLHSQGVTHNEDSVSATTPGKVTSSTACSCKPTCMWNTHRVSFLFSFVCTSALNVFCFFFIVVFPFISAQSLIPCRDVHSS